MKRARSFLASAAAVAVTAAGLSLVTPATPAFASTSFALSPTAPVAGESFAATGKVSTSFKRPVVLKVYSGGAWRTAKKGWTTTSGTYRFPAGMKVSRATAYDVAARAYKYKGRSTARPSGSKRIVRPVGQSAPSRCSPRCPSGAPARSARPPRRQLGASPSSARPVPAARSPSSASQRRR